MNYADFRKMVLRLPVISSKDILFFERKRQSIRNQLNRWQDRGLVVKLRRGMYILNENDRKVNPSRQFIANQLYAPSYVSLEYALNLYGLIPERVTEVTNVSTRKTVTFKNALGVFVYQHIKPAAFSGFKAARDEAGLSFFIALPEKAVVDFLYLNINKMEPSDTAIFGASYRFQNTESLSRAKIMKMATLFGNEKLTRLAGSFCQFIKNERKS
ncbi:MAG: hypothetical protein NTW09_05880 [Candidatus Omnitrophica bacterium]|nr:hypothetical protein [Candidatus Omnitrophota bacterium]